MAYLYIIIIIIIIVTIVMRAYDDANNYDDADPGGELKLTSC